MQDILVEKRKHVLWLQWLLVVAVSYLLYASKPAVNTFGLYELAILTFITVNATLFLIPPRVFQSTYLDFVLVFVDIVFIALAIYMSGQATSDFYLFFFLVLMMAAAGQNLKALMMGILTISGLYAFMVYKSGEFTLSSAFLLRIPFLFIVGLFFGYLVYVQKLGEERLQAESEFTVDLFEFGKALVQAEDLEMLYEQVPRLIQTIMMTDACELALIDQGRITRRVLEDSGSRELPLLEVERSIHARTYASDRIEFSTDMSQDPDFARQEDKPFYPYRYYMGKSWKPTGRPSGLISIYRVEEPWSQHDVKKFQFLTDQTVLALQYVQLLKELEMQARTDGLTGLANFRYFSKRIEEEFSRARRKKSSLSLILTDVDHFKEINDTLGHAAGDDILRHYASLLRKNSRQMDLPARRGGDEFAVLLPETDETEAMRVARRILEQTQEEVDGLPPFSISLGCATFPQNGGSVADLMEHADQALYQAKAGGRNCCRHYSELAQAPPESPRSLGGV